MPDIRKLVWYELVDTKFGDEYLILYTRRQRTIRKWFKALTILLSASGIWSAFESNRIWSIISCGAIALVQGATSIENFIIHSEDDLDDLTRLRLMYFDKFCKLEELWHDVETFTIDLNEAKKRFYNLREKSRSAEELDSKLHIWQFTHLKKSADIRARNYLNTYLS